MKHLKITLLLLLLILPVVSSITVNIPEPPIIPGANYSINVNYSEQSGNANLFNDYSVSGLYTYFKGLLDLVYAPLSSLNNYWSKTENINATGYNVTADKFNMGLNNSYGIYSNGTDFIMGYIEGL